MPKKKKKPKSLFKRNQKYAFLYHRMREGTESIYRKQIFWLIMTSLGRQGYPYNETDESTERPQPGKP